MRKAKTRAWLLMVALVGCKYDLDKIYEHDVQRVDAGSDDDGGVALVGMWRDQDFVDDDCARCARSQCESEDLACRSDRDCASLTSCVAQRTDPNTQADCRAEHAAWLAEDPEARILGGPLYSCAFRDKCAEQCGTHTDWSCLGQYSWELTSRKSLAFTFQFVNALGGEPAAGLSVKVCRAVEDPCTAPSSTGTTDERGIVKVTLPTTLRSFGGYLELAGAGWYPTLVHLGWPVARDGVLNVPIVTAEGVEQNVSAADVAPDPARGLLQVRMFGCAGVGMRGVSFTSTRTDENSQTWYAVPFPSFEDSATGDLGSGGVVNVIPGLATVSARRKSDDVLVARTRAPVRAGFLSIVVLSPLDASQ